MTTREEASSTVSVVIPTFNRAEKCARAVASVLAQTHGEVQAIVVDDGSTDDTEDRIRGLDDDRVTYLWQENAGVAAARNRGFREAKGGYVALLDSDDVWLPHKLELQLRVLRHFGDAVMTWSDMSATDVDGRVVSQRYLRTMYAAYADFDFASAWDESVALPEIWPECPDQWRTGLAHVGDVFASMFMGNLVHTSTALMRADTRNAVGDFDESLVKTGEDYDYHLRTCARGRVVLVDLPTVLYQVGGADQLTAPGLLRFLAENNLKTMQKAWSAHADRIDLPAGKLRRRWSDAHRWLGRTLFNSDVRVSRQHLLLSLRHRPLQPRTVLMLLLTFLPERVLSGLRMLRGRGSRGGGSSAGVVDAQRSAPRREGGVS